jgi:hypothetical protein
LPFKCNLQRYSAGSFCPAHGCRHPGCERASAGDGFLCLLHAPGAGGAPAATTPTTTLPTLSEAAAGAAAGDDDEVGLCTLNQVDP